MRAVLFRGKRHDGIWMYGDLLHSCCNTYTIIQPEMIQRHIVLEETVGQFTGLYDKNGMRIFEGDIVDAWSAGEHLPNGIIKWGEGIAGFFIMPPKYNAVWHLVGDNENKETLVVIGNIHDNPELLTNE